MRRSRDYSRLVYAYVEYNCEVRYLGGGYLQLRRDWVSDRRYLNRNGCYKLREAWQGKVEAAWQSRVGNSNPGHQCYWLGDPAVYHR